MSEKKEKRDKKDKKERKEKKAKKEPRKAEPVIVTVKLGENEYTGTIGSGSLDARFLDCSDAQYSWGSGAKYEGQFVGSKIEGKGRFVWADGSSYDGQFHNGKRHGNGVYFAANNITRYEGSWQMGKRHGRGRLTYSEDLANGFESFYDGEWYEGRKHGVGMQVWASGASYNGEWIRGRMKGAGTMVWSEIDEEYVGNWERNRPQGEGCHTWFAAVPRPDQDPKAGPAQQMNNRYEGAFNKGGRHGHGTFSFADGSSYKGDWQENKKHGQGLVTLEDGSVYDGPFESDKMVEHASLFDLNRNVGGNPVSNTIDISDLDVLAYPSDCRGFSGEMHTGCDKAHMVIKDVHNTLLRHLGELKQLYFRYRTILVLPGEDPFLLSMHQFWTFARDFNLVTASCPLSRLNRFIVAGPRQHREMSPADIPTLRPLTPQHWSDRRPAAGPEGQLDVPDGGTRAVSKSGVVEHAAPTGVNRLVVEQVEDNDSSSCALSSRTAGSPASATAGQSLLIFEEAQAELAAVGEGSDSSALTEGEYDVGGDLPEVSPFWREEKPTDVSDIHLPTRQLLFRHFLDGIARLALARFPNEKSLQQQMSRLFKEHIEPNFQKLTVSKEVFNHLTNDDIWNVLSDYEPLLWRCFKNNAAGEGAYAAPPGTRTLPALALPRGKRSKPPANIETSDEPEPLRRRGWGGQHRRMHLCARLDVTIRVKDLLRLLDKSGLLSPTPAKDLPVDARAPLFSNNVGFAGLSVEQDVQEELQELGFELQKVSPESIPMFSEEEPAEEPARRQLAHRNAVVGIPGDRRASASQIDLDVGLLDRRGVSNFPKIDAKEIFDSQGNFDFDSPAKSRVGFKGADRDGSFFDAASSRRTTRLRRSTDTSFCPTLPESELEQRLTKQSDSNDERGRVLSCDFTLTFMDVLRIITEVHSPESLENLCLHTNPGGGPCDEHVSLLDYLETELIFPEFTRFLLRMADSKMQADDALCKEFPLFQRFDGFLKDVFLPSLKRSYTPPGEAETDNFEEHMDTNLQVPAVPPDSEAQPEPLSSDPTASPTEVPVEIPQSQAAEKIWSWFDNSQMDLEDSLAPRVWCSNYEFQVADW